MRTKKLKHKGTNIRMRKVYNVWLKKRLAQLKSTRVSEHGMVSLGVNALCIASHKKTTVSFAMGV